MPGMKGKSGRKPSLAKNLDSKHLDRRDRAEEAKAISEQFGPIGEPPKRLDRDGRRLWREIVRQMAHSSLLTSLDASLLEEYVTQVELAREADRAIYEHGALILDENGKPVRKNPAVDVKNQVAKNLKAIGAVLGLDPMSRTSMLASAPPDDSDEETAEDAIAKFGGGA